VGGVEALAHQAALHVDDTGEDGVDGAGVHVGLEFVEGEVGWHDVSSDWKRASAGWRRRMVKGFGGHLKRREAHHTHWTAGEARNGRLDAL